MSFGTSETYIYAYIAFASVYLVASFTFVASALRVSTGLSKRSSAATAEEISPTAVTLVVDHGQKVVDYTQLSTLLPLVYIVGSMFLGSVIGREVALARTINVVWIVFTVLCAVASIGLAVLGIRESGAIGSRTLPAQTPEAVQRIGVRLGVSAALLLLVAVFTALNLWSIISSLDALSKVDFLL
jgi:quinol-cytochrome oxidoreductase complex cytochrome b subunit